MKIAVSAISEVLDVPVDHHFGRCPYFVIVETEIMQFEVLNNSGRYATHQNIA